MTLAEVLKAKGIEDEVIKGILEDMKANKIFTASEENLDVRYGKLKTDHDSVIKERDEGKALIAELQKSNKGNEALQRQVSDYEAKMAQIQAELEQTKIESEAKVGLLAAKALDVDYLLFKLKEKGELSRGDDGKVKGLDDMIDALKTQFPMQFETTSQKHYQEHRLPDGDPGDKSVTKEEFNKMGYNSRVELKQNNPELYSQLMKG
jgi:ABC-type phosphate transport system auxiliary subunit